MKRSGLKDIIRDYTFDKFVASEPWQQTIKEAAVNYSENPNGWFALFGQSGCGKTHLCTAISRKFLLDGKRVVYMLWRDEIVRIKDAARGGDDSEELRKLLDRYKTADVLYIDDLFKTGRAADNTMPKPTPADINYAFEIINYRYNNPALLTIISSEMTIDELLDIDEAIGGRIYERATAFTIGKSREKNYRLKKAVTL
jgi:DNA replication protein DnaC